MTSLERETDNWREDEGLVLCQECNEEEGYPEVHACPLGTEKKGVSVLSCAVTYTLTVPFLYSFS